MEQQSKTQLRTLLKPHRSSLIIGVGFSFILAALILVQFYGLSQIVNIMFLSDNKTSVPGKYLLLFTAGGIGRYLLSFLQHIILESTATRVSNRLFHQLTDKVKHLGPMVLQAHDTGTYLSIFHEGLDKIKLYITDYLPQLVISTIIPVTILLVTLPIDILTFIVFLLTAPLIPVFMILIGQQTKKQSEKQWLSLQRMSAFFLDTLRGLQTLKIFSAYREHLHKIKMISEDFRIKTMNILKIAFLSAFVLELVATISTAIVAVEIGLRLMAGNMEFQEALFLLMLAPEYYLPLRTLGSKFHTGKEGKEALFSIFSFLNQSNKLRFDGSGKINKIDTIEFKNITYCYQPDTPILQNLNLRINKNDKIVIVGSSGSGKTTLVQLLLAFDQPQQGEIRINGIPLTEIHPPSLWGKIGFVPQQPIIFHRSIGYNIFLNENYSNIPLPQTFNWLQDILSSKSDGLHTIVGEEGARTSGGQKQRIALSRIFTRTPELVIIDEPTASLDKETEKQFLTDLGEFIKDKTAILIAHRKETVKLATRVILVADGTIKQEMSPVQFLEREANHPNNKWDLIES
ncbi:MAG: thiol reductant ABC exporter subunit CydD [Calditrichia bacterium]